MDKALKIWERRSSKIKDVVKVGKTSRNSFQKIAQMEEKGETTLLVAGNRIAIAWSAYCEWTVILIGQTRPEKFQIVKNDIEKEDYS